MLSASAQSLVAVPFLSEDPQLVAATLREAISHPSVTQAVGIHGGDLVVADAVAELIQGQSGIWLIPQQRFGVLRPGKGDAINTGFRLFLDETRYQRLHFYDADIKSFGRDWISKAELALDAGYEAVRHFYPRATSDGMITWMITRPGFGLLWPDSVLPWIEQPMSGEVAFDRRAVAALASDPTVVEQSDWGIDTAITHRSVGLGLSIYESFVPQGKDHQLYGSLGELRLMLLECLHTLQRLRNSPPPGPIRHTAEIVSTAPPPITEKEAYDRLASESLLTPSWTARQLRILRSHFPSALVAMAEECVGSPPSAAIDTSSWLAALSILLEAFQPASEDWQEIAFRLWVGRVLSYSHTTNNATYDEKMGYLLAMVRVATTR